MSRRVGFDLVAPASVRASLDAHGERWLRRTFTAGEIADCQRAAGLDVTALAARVAAKEATFKALAVDDRPVAWTDVEVGRDGSGAPRLMLSGLAANLLQSEGIDELTLSLSHAGELAAAVVIGATRSSCRYTGV